MPKGVGIFCFFWGLSFAATHAQQPLHTFIESPIAIFGNIMPRLSTPPVINRELSWLSFNERVLQEAESSSVPLIERLRFIGIFSNNMDEFFRVRVATIKRMAGYKREAKRDLGVNPVELLNQIQDRVLELQKRFDKAYFRILEDMVKENIHIINEQQLEGEQGAFVKAYFREKVRLQIFPLMIDKSRPFPVLQDSSIYLAIRLNQVDDRNANYSLIEIPSTVSRFVVLPSVDSRTCIMFLDDVIRYNLEEIYRIYDYQSVEAYTIKFTKDAELDIDNDVSQTFMESVEASLQQRKHAEPLRLIHDAEMPREFLQFLIKKMNFSKQGHVVPGVRYHNFKDFMNFPHLGKKEHFYEQAAAVPHPVLHHCKSILAKMKERDMMLYYPYHSFDYFLDLLREAAIDPDVSHIRMTVYRLSTKSNVIKSLLTAVQNGKDVTIMIELRARFDEEANIDWANKLREAGVRVITGVSGLKVHSKVCLITRREKGKKIYYGCFGSGNFHEKTARFYTDALLMTSDQSITREARELFDFFERNYQIPRCQRLLLAPFALRNKINGFINREIRNARAGKRAEIFIKMNSLVDEALVQKLYMASKAGVKIRLIIRGICSLIPGMPGISENIRAISIVDKYLEHSRFFVFYNNGRPEVYLGSADLMTRNLDFRVEVLCPVLHPELKEQVIDLMELQWQDNVKSRIFDQKQSNHFRPSAGNGHHIRSQEAIRDYFLHLYQLSKTTEIETGSY
jgi:polyphosphate kinase